MKDMSSLYSCLEKEKCRHADRASAKAERKGCIASVHHATAIQYPPAQEHYDHISCLQEGEAVHVRSHGMAVSTCLWTCAAGSRPPMQTTALRRAAVRQTKL